MAIKSLLLFTILDAVDTHTQAKSVISNFTELFNFNAKKYQNSIFISLSHLLEFDANKLNQVKSFILNPPIQ